MGNESRIGVFVVSATLNQFKLFVYCKGEVSKRKKEKSREILLVVVSECLHILPSLVEVEEEEQLVSEAGKLMRGGEGSGGGEKGGTGADIRYQRVHSLV